MLKKIITTVIITILFNNVFGQFQDTLFLDSKFQKGSVLTKDTAVGFNNFLFFYDKSSGLPVNGIVLTSNKKDNFTRYEVKKGICQSWFLRSGRSETMTAVFDSIICTMKSFKGDKLISFYRSEMKNGQLLITAIKIEKEKYIFKQTFFEQDGKLREQKFTIINLELLYDLPNLVPLQEFING